MALKKPSESWTELITSIQPSTQDIRISMYVCTHPSRSTSAALSIRSLSGYSDIRLVDYLSYLDDLVYRRQVPKSERLGPRFGMKMAERGNCIQSKSL